MRRVGLVLGEPVDLLLAVHRVPQVQPRAQLEVALLEAAFQHQDRPAPAERADALRLVEIEQREAVRSSETIERPFYSVPVGIGLDDGPDARIRSGFAGSSDVVREGVDVDQGFDGTGHARILPAASHGVERGSVTEVTGWRML